MLEEHFGRDVFFKENLLASTGIPSETNEPNSVEKLEKK
jgi:hypothetical protein